MSGDSDRRDDVALAAVPGCPSAAALAAFASGRLSDQELVTIADHVSHCETCESAVRGASSQEDSLTKRLRAAVLQATPLEEPACLRMQAAAQAIRPPRDESTAETEIEAGSGESRSAAGPTR
jgi:anti-sigma factor ChrR (cupin superfamily)